jgi:predicted GTPase
MGESASKHMRQDIPELDDFDKETAVEYEKAFKDGGMSYLNKKIEKDMNKWRNVPVTIAVTGNSGVGKSSFINSFRGLSAGSEGAAAVSVNEMTMKPTEYMHPNNNSIALWDLPGIGTENFPKERYLEEVKFEKYDFFLIMTAKRFTENDIWLAKEVQKLKKKFFFVRTNMDTEVANNKRDKGKSKSETVKEIQEYMTQHVTETHFKNIKVYLIDNYSERDYDFQILIEAMIKEAPEFKQKAIVLTMTNLTENLINRKREALRERILVVALGSAAGGAVPVVGASLAIDTAIIVGEVIFYKQQFGLNDKSLKKTSNLLKLATDKLKGRLRTGVATAQMISHFATQLAASECAEKVTAFVLPVLGSIIAAGISYGSTVSILMSLLEECVSDAYDINKQLMEKMSE